MRNIYTVLNIATSAAQRHKIMLRDFARLLKIVLAGYSNRAKLHALPPPRTIMRSCPGSKHGFALHKGSFHDALALRYGWSPSEMPSKCACGNNLSVEHALSCAKGGFPSIRHNEIHDLTATLLTEVCHDVCTARGRAVNQVEDPFSVAKSAALRSETGKFS